jgi:tRNA U34 2-thiouridine synthase MnmA/TrmU
MYVAGKDMQQRVVYVALGQDHPALFASSAALQEAHWIAGQPPQALQESRRLECTFKARWGSAIALIEKYDYLYLGRSLQHQMPR